MKNQEFKNGLISVEVVKNNEDGVEFKCIIQKEMLMTMFDQYDFKRNVETFLAERLIRELPIEILNEIRSKIDLNVVAKLTTIKMAENATGNMR